MSSAEGQHGRSVGRAKSPARGGSRSALSIAARRGNDRAGSRNGERRDATDDMPSCDARILFAAAAGPRRGFGHLVRCVSFARALGVRPLIAVRGKQQVIDAALALGADVLRHATPRVVRALRPDVVIIDDPIESSARRWIAAARRAGALVVTVHDLGIGCSEGDLAIDGSVTRGSRLPRGRASLTGSQYAVLDPRLTTHLSRQRTNHRRKVDPEPNGHRVVIALGGGPRLRLAGAIAEAIVAAEPRAEVRIAGGFVVAPRPASSNVVWIGASRGLAAELSQAAVAVVGGGVSLYEACALGVPAVGVPVVTGQEPTVRAFGRRGAALAAPYGASADAVAERAVALLNDPALRQSLSRRGRALVDGRGAARAAAAVVALSDAGPGRAGRYLQEKP
jgi:UDP-2,4-diacetamido-2,4,6-trideoxy-beta-L-altropyranose hydrolase